MAKTSRALVLATALVLFVPLPGTATQRYGPVEMSGNLQSQNLVRHPDDEHFQFIQNRNTTHLQFDNQLREAYTDIKFRGIPLSVRAGRQQIVWGESDDFRMLDRANTLDLTWHLAQEVPPPAFGWDELRRPFWMFKFLYGLGNIWHFSQNFLEWYWNPGDWAPAKVAFQPRPWGLNILDPLNNPVDGGFIAGPCALSPFVIGRGPNKGQHRCLSLMNGTTLFKQGNYQRNPFDNSQVGVRYHSFAPFGLEFALVYFYQRWGGDDGTNYAPVRALPLNSQN